MYVEGKMKYKRQKNYVMWRGLWDILPWRKQRKTEPSET
jgi:hypothetical protein